MILKLMDTLIVSLLTRIHFSFLFGEVMSELFQSHYDRITWSFQVKTITATEGQELATIAHFQDPTIYPYMEYTTA